LAAGFLGCDFFSFDALAFFFSDFTPFLSEDFDPSFFLTFLSFVAF
jgi:hypothetical protein